MRVLNPSPAPVVIHQNEKIGKLVPLDQHDSVSTLGHLSWEQKLQKPKPSDVEWAIAQLTDTQTRKRKLEALLHEFTDVLSVSDKDLGCTTLSNTRLTGVMLHLYVNHQGDYHSINKKWSNNMLTRCWKMELLNHQKGPGPHQLSWSRKRWHHTIFHWFQESEWSHQKKDAHPLPRIDDTLDTLGGAQWFSTLDLANGYCQVEVDPADREKQPLPLLMLYQFRVMPFWLCNAPETFQRLKEQVLQGLHWSTCLAYVDEIIIFSMTVEEHLTRLLMCS